MTAGFQMLLKLGGPVAIVLISMSVVAMTLTLVKLYQYFRAGVGSGARVESQAIDLWLKGQPEPARQSLAGRRQPKSRVIHYALELLSRRNVDLEAAKEETLRLATDEVRSLNSYLRGIEIIAQSAPLLGLLGTVIGMIQAFNRMESSGANVNPALLAGGIWTALLATALGLVIAIVFSIAVAWLELRVEAERAGMESLLTNLFARQAMGI